MIVRYLVRVSPDKGHVDTVVWLLVEGESEEDHLLVEDTFEHLTPDMREDRILNVDGDCLTFGIPSDEAFAAVRIPQGISREFPDERRTYAGRVDFRIVGAPGFAKSIFFVDDASLRERPQ